MALLDVAGEVTVTVGPRVVTVKSGKLITKLANLVDSILTSLQFQIRISLAAQRPN